MTPTPENRAPVAASTAGGPMMGARFPGDPG